MTLEELNENIQKSIYSIEAFYQKYPIFVESFNKDENYKRDRYTNFLLVDEVHKKMSHEGLQIDQRICRFFTNYYSERIHARRGEIN